MWSRLHSGNNNKREEVRERVVEAVMQQRRRLLRVAEGIFIAPISLRHYLTRQIYRCVDIITIITVIILATTNIIAHQHHRTPQPQQLIPNHRHAVSAPAAFDKPGY